MFCSFVGFDNYTEIGEVYWDVLRLLCWCKMDHYPESCSDVEIYDVIHSRSIGKDSLLVSLGCLRT